MLVVLGGSTSVGLGSCTRVAPGNDRAQRTDEPEPSRQRPAPSQPSESDPWVQVVQDEVNSHRTARGREPLVLDPDLSYFAEEHSREMASGRIPFGHAGFDERARAIGRSIRYETIAENVGWNRGEADPAAAAVANWLRSPPHLANITGEFELTGIGVARSENGDYYFTQIFLKPSR